MGHSVGNTPQLPPPMPSSMDLCGRAADARLVILKRTAAVTLAGAFVRITHVRNGSTIALAATRGRSGTETWRTARKQ
jgi:hypothetical protein